jgi:hypothetical protein
MAALTCMELSLVQLKRDNKIQRNISLSFPDVFFPQIHRSVSVVLEEILFKLWPPTFIIFLYPVYFFSTPDENIESRFHCRTLSVEMLRLSAVRCCTRLDHIKKTNKLRGP